MTSYETYFTIVLVIEKVYSLKCNSFVSVCPVWLNKYNTVWTLLLDWKNSVGGSLVVILWVSHQELPKQKKHTLPTNQFKHFSVSVVNTKIFHITSILKCSQWNHFINISYIEFAVNFLCCPAYSPVKSTDLSDDGAS